MIPAAARGPAARAARARLTARDVMTAPVITVRPETTVKDVAGLMVAHHVSGLPVVTEGGDLVGIVTEADLLYKEQGPRPKAAGLRAVRALFGGRDEARKADGLSAAALMSRPVITVEEETPLHEIASLMVRRRVNRVPVLRAGRLAGIVSRADVMEAFTRTDAEIEAAVRATLLQDLWTDVTRISITAHDGVVTLDGQVERRSEQDLVTRWVAAVDGVVGVTGRLTYDFDDRAVHLGERWPGARV